MCVCVFPLVLLRAYSSYYDAIERAFAVQILGLSVMILGENKADSFRPKTQQHVHMQICTNHSTHSCEAHVQEQQMHYNSSSWELGLGTTTTNTTTHDSWVITSFVELNNAH